eukprot:TRINITY_DN11756_c0_g1_i1.p1 TRINITY_DN11756_c0_g1~~TRINITY_DN11756_c0_g1_i1.p1  ORF type:complete len:463 (+),score=131.42 TRINITY_DN11756_c0_g1_i1:108-1496(+)
MGLCRKKEEEEEIHKEGDKAICGTLCVCQALAVLSTVSIIYLSVIIYLPAKRELESGIGETPVMCTTIESRHIDNDIELCKSTSCAEWCLSKGGNSCDHLFVNVRQNGTDVDFEGCHEVVEKTCPVLDESLTNSRNCAKDHHCTSLDQMFMCEAGMCTNITDVFSCTWAPEDAEPPLNCFYKRNCVELDGMYSCTDGYCSRLANWKCERACRDIPTSRQNVISMAGDKIVSAHCRVGINSRTGEKIWEFSDNPDTILISSCTTVEVMSDGELVRGSDCINGTKMPNTFFEEYTNFTHLMKVFHGEGWKHKLDMPDRTSELPRGTHIPFDTDIKIYNKTMLYINHEGCVNTLQYECDQFYKIHGQDSRNQSSPSRFPCYYSSDNPDFVVQRYDLIQTKISFLMFFTIPAGCFITSCLVLLICSNLVGVRRSGTMAIMPRCCGMAQENREIKMEILKSENIDED